MTHFVTTVKKRSPGKLYLDITVMRKQLLFSEPAINSFTG